MISINYLTFRGQRMSQKETRFIITSPTIDTYIFIIPLNQIIQHLLNFHSSNGRNQKIIRICYLIVIDDLSDYIEMQNKFHALQWTQIYNPSLIPFNSEEQAIEHVNMMKKMNGSQFQDQYLEMISLLEREIEAEILKQFCNSQLQWSWARIDNLVEREGVNSINKFLNYRGFNQLEALRIRSIWGFIHSLSK